MRAPNYYTHPGFERAGLRRREPDWIRERVLDPATVFIPVWRTQNLVIEIAESEPRAASITVEGLAAVFGALDDIDERLARGEFVFLGVIDERAHFALDVSSVETPLEMLRSPALAAAGIAEAAVRFADLRQLGARLERHEGALLAFSRAMLFWHSRHRFCGLCGNPTRSEEAGQDEAIKEAEEGIQKALDTGQAVELAPQNSFTRPASIRSLPVTFQLR